MKSWKTTSAGILMIAGAIVRAGFAWKAKSLSEEAVMTILTTLVGGIGLILARDNDKSSEDVGAKPVSKTGPTGSILSSLLLIIGLSVAPLTFTGCAWFKPSTVAVGSDPVVVGAEQTAALALAYTGEFLKWEWVNRSGLPRDVTVLADRVRGEFPQDYASFRAATKAYKANRTPQNKLSLNTASALLNALLEQVRTRLPEAQQAVAKAAAKTIKTN